VLGMRATGNCIPGMHPGKREKVAENEKQEEEEEEEDEEE